MEEEIKLSYEEKEKKFNKHVSDVILFLFILLISVSIFLIIKNG
jgi:hypothetical protein